MTPLAPQLKPAPSQTETASGALLPPQPGQRTLRSPAATRIGPPPTPTPPMGQPRVPVKEPLLLPVETAFQLASVADIAGPAEEKLERASSACSHAGGVKVAARNLLAEPRSAGNEETWKTLVTKFPSEDHTAVSATTADAVLASATEGEDGNVPKWRRDDEYASEVLFDAITFRSTLSGPGNDGQRSAHLQSIIHTDIGMEEFGRGMTAFRRRIVDEPDAFPPEFWQLFMQSSLTTLEEKCRPVSVGMAWTGLITAGAMRHWQPTLEVSREVRQFRVAVPEWSM